MRIEQLLYFLDIAKTKSFSRTAQNFFITQQGASDAVKKLEKEFDVTLFHRTKQGAVLTDIGQSFVETAQEMVLLYQQLQEKAQAHRVNALAALDGELTILAHPRIFQHLLPSVIQTYRRHCPNVRLRISESQSDEILRQVLSGAIVLGLVVLPEKKRRTSEDPFAAYTEHLTFEHLLVDDMVVCTSSSAPFRDRDSLTTEMIADFPVVAYNLGFFGESASASIVFTSNNIAFHKNLVEQNLAVDIMTRFEYQKLYGDDDHFIAIPVTDERLTITMVTQIGAALSPEARYFASLIRNFQYR